MGKAHSFFFINEMAFTAYKLNAGSPVKQAL